MNTYRFTGTSDGKFLYEGQDYLVTTLDYGIGFYAEIKAPSLRKALKYVDNILSDVPFTLSSAYSVTNRYGKLSVRFLKEVKK